MAKKDSTPKPLSRRTLNRSMQARPALSGNLTQVTRSIFVAGGEDAPKVKTKVIPVERKVDGQKSLHYEIRLEVNGVRMGERSSPPPIRGEAVKERIPQERLRE